MLLCSISYCLLYECSHTSYVILLSIIFIGYNDDGTVCAERLGRWPDTDWRADIIPQCNLFWSTMWDGTGTSCAMINERRWNEQVSLCTAEFHPFNLQLVPQTCIQHLILLFWSTINLLKTCWLTWLPYFYDLVCLPCKCTLNVSVISIGKRFYR